MAEISEKVGGGWFRRGRNVKEKRGGVEIGDPFLARLFRIYIPVLLFIFITLFPFYWMFITSLKSDTELLDFHQLPIFVREPTLKNYQDLFQHTYFPRWALNTAIVAVVSTGISPPVLYNSLWALILTYPTLLIPFCTWLLIGYFKGIPRELEESALVDGATRLQAMVRVVIPLALPGILSAGMFAFTLSWNEYLYSLIFMNDPVTKTIPVGVTQDLIRGDEFFWGQLMAAALLGSVPVALLYSFFVDHFVAGMTAGAVKG